MRHKYVQVADNVPRKGMLALGSEATCVRQLDETGLVAQVIARMANAAAPTSDRWLHEGMDASVLTNKCRRELENTQAIGGLRSPHMSIAKLKAAPQFGTWILDF